MTRRPASRQAPPGRPTARGAIATRTRAATSPGRAGRGTGAAPSCDLADEPTGRRDRQRADALPPPPPRSRLTQRAAILGLVVCGLMLMLAYPFREYLAQRTEIAALRTDTQRSEQQVRALQQLQAAWNDPNFVRQQARERLHFVLPGETDYIVERPAPPAEREASKALPGGTALPDSNAPWFSRLWSSTVAADTP